MARINTLKKSTRGKAITCSKCGKEIKPGDTYLKATPYKRNPIIRCTTCGLQQYETSGSEYIREVGAIAEDWEDSFDADMSGVNEIIDNLRTLKDQCEESLENMPEQLQEGDAGETLQARIDNLDEVISELEEITDEECRDTADEELLGEFPEEYDPEDERCSGYETEGAWKAAREERMDEEMARAFSSRISSALIMLEY